MDESRGIAQEICKAVNLEWQPCVNLGDASRRDFKADSGGPSNDRYLEITSAIFNYFIGSLPGQKPPKREKLLREDL